MCSNIICHVYTRPLFLRRAQKASPEPPRRKSIRCALMPLTPMQQSCRSRCVMVRLIFNISPIAWRNATVQGRASISQTTHTTTSTHLWTQVHRSSAPSLPQPKFCAKLMSTTDSLDFKAVAKAWPWNAFSSPILNNLDAGILRKLEFKKTDLKVFGIRWSLEKPFLALQSRRAKWIRTTHQTRLNVFKHHLPCLHTSAVFETGSKSLSRTTTTNKSEQNQSVGPWCLRHRWCSFADSDAWGFDLCSTSQQAPGGIKLCSYSQTTHTTTSTHLWTQVHRSSAPSLRQCPLPAKLMSTTVLLDCKAVAKAWPPWKTFRAIQFWCLLEKRKIRCFDLRVLGLKRFFEEVVSIHKSKQVQNSWRSHDAKIEMS